MVAVYIRERVAGFRLSGVTGEKRRIIKMQLENAVFPLPLVLPLSLSLYFFLSLSDSRGIVFTETQSEHRKNRRETKPWPEA